ncbi:hypothetical protein [Vibrio fluvialis]|uniref:hypothetical protein n=1 Tax=Vibrio fluvialis TaxID=676 RepID=UPI0013022609|nr:hypothetical protein [Vibrio fluvialis]
MTLSQLDTSSTNTPKATCVSPQEHSGSNKNDASKVSFCPVCNSAVIKSGFCSITCEDKFERELMMGDK